MGFRVEVGLASFAEGNEAQLDLARRIVASDAVPLLRYVTPDSQVALHRRPDGALDEETLPASALGELSARAEKLGIVFFSTPFDDGSADLLQALGVPAFKTGSWLKFSGRSDAS